MLCNRCKKRMAVLFISRMENGKPITEGLCFQCAKELNVPQISEVAKKMGLTDEDLDAMDNQLASLMEEGFEPGGANIMNPFVDGFSNQSENKSPKSNISGKGESDKKTVDKKPKNKFLNNYCNHLTQRAREGKLDKIIGRENEIYRVIQILSRRTKNNPCLIGEPGVGKTAIAEGIAQKIIEGKVPYRLANKELYLLDMTALIAGTQFRGQFESRIKGLINEIVQAGNIILFIDEVHTLVGTGDSEGSLSAANILKPALSRGEIQVIGATTFDEYRKYIESDSALERRFQQVKVEEPTIEDTVVILNGIKNYYESYHKVKIKNAQITEAVMLSERYITDRFLPDKAIDLLDEACAHRALRAQEITEYEKLNDQLKTIRNRLSDLESNIENPDYEKMAEIKSEESIVTGKLLTLEKKLSTLYVQSRDFARVIELWTGIPASKIEQDDVMRLASLEEKIKQKIIGQDQAIHLVAAAIKRNRIQLSKRRRPASFIFVGPTGVGKTELVKVLSSILFNDVDPLIRLDMSEFMEKHAVSRLIGSPPGYVGYDDAGQLTEKVRRHPYSVVLFDEIEKAHPDVMNILLQILDEGRVTDAHGRKVNFENTVIVMTSNAGSSDKVGIAGFDKTNDEIGQEKYMKGLSNFLRPEFLSRVDEVVSFRSLSEDDLEQIAELMIGELKEILEEKEITLSYHYDVVRALVKSARKGKYGARDLRKEVRKHLEDAIASILVDYYREDVHSIDVNYQNDQFEFSVNDSNAVVFPALSTEVRH